MPNKPRPSTVSPCSQPGYHSNARGYQRSRLPPFHCFPLLLYAGSSVPRNQSTPTQQVPHQSYNALGSLWKIPSLMPAWIGSHAGGLEKLSPREATECPAMSCLGPSPARALILSEHSGIPRKECYSRGLQVFQGRDCFILRVCTGPSTKQSRSQLGPLGPT